MKKHKSKQFSRHNNLKALVVTVFISIVSLVPVVIALQSWSLLNHSAKNIVKYNGLCNVTKKRYTRNTVWLFYLDNGDVVEVPVEYLNDNVIDDLKRYCIESEPISLEVWYSQHHRFLKQSHSAITITAISNGTEYVSQETMREVFCREGFLFSIIAFPMLIVSCVMWFGVFYFLIWQRVKRHKRHKKDN